MARHVMFVVSLLIVLIQLVLSQINDFTFNGVENGYKTHFGPYLIPQMHGNRSVIVKLFEWRWDDIADECEQFLGPYGYGGVQTSPPNENAIIEHPVKRPWYERYQPVSYKLITRSGNEQQFINMVERCNAAKVRIYVDVVLNHMTRSGLWGNGIGGSYYDADLLQYDGVPFSSKNFNDHDKCLRKDLDINNYNDPKEIRDCRLNGIWDLDQSQDYVRNTQVNFLNHLIDIGVAGFFMNGSRFQRVADLTAIISRLNPLNPRYFPPNSKPFIYHENYHCERGKTLTNPFLNDYTSIGRQLDYRYPYLLGDTLRRINHKLWETHVFGEGHWGMHKNEWGVAMVDNHDLQRGDAGSDGVTISFFEPRLLKMATAFMLSWRYYVPIVMSSYNWTRNFQGQNDVNSWYGPPHDENYNIKRVIRNADGTCGNGWVCEHRWRQIANMVKFRYTAGFDAREWERWPGPAVDQIGFRRGIHDAKGYFLMNNERDKDINTKIYTHLLPGLYCDVISGSLENGRCTGKTIKVEANRWAHFDIKANDDDPMIAIHVNAKIA